MSGEGKIGLTDGQLSTFAHEDADERSWGCRRGEEEGARAGESCELTASTGGLQITRGAAGGALRFARRLCAGDSTGAGIIYSTAAVLLLYSNRGHGMLSALSGLRWV